MTKETIKQLTLEALTTDGTHHKQWFLEKILEGVCSKQEFEKIKQKHDFGWSCPP